MTANAIDDLPRDEAIEQLRTELRIELQLKAALEAENRELQEQNAFLRRALYSPSSERTRPAPDPSQQQLFGVEAPAAPEPPEAPAPVESETITYTRKKGHGRQPVSRELAVIEQIIEVPAEERVAVDGTPLVLTGYEESERIHLVPEQLVRLLIKRERWGLPDTRETVVVAPTLATLVPKGKATDAFIHELLVRKFVLGLPLYRQMQDLNSRGAALSDSFLGDCVRQAAAVYAPIHAALRAQVLAQRFVHADETPMRQLGGPDGAITGYLWAWLGGAQIYFHYAPSRAQSEVRTVLGIDDSGTWEEGTLIGFLMCDGYAGYNPAFSPRADAQPAAIRLACWAHVRRKFKDCVHDANAQQVVELINDLFRVEREARKEIEKRRLDRDAAAALRLERRRALSRPLVERIRVLLDQLRPLYDPSRTTARAIHYTTELWDALIVYLDHGDLPMDNNAAERAIRPVVIGRKNYLFVGSEDGGTWAACFYSLLESCRMQGIDPRRYLAHVTPLLIGERAPPPEQLTPAALATVLGKG